MGNNYMSKDLIVSAENSNRILEEVSSKFRVRPFNSRLLKELISEFEIRNAMGSWCGYALLDTVPKELHCCIDTPIQSRKNPLCTVMFLKGSNTQNYLFRTDEFGYILLSHDFRILHSGASLSDALDMVQIRCYRN